MITDPKTNHVTYYCCLIKRVLFKSLKDNKLTTVITELFHELRFMINTQNRFSKVQICLLSSGEGDYENVC